MRAISNALVFVFLLARHIHIAPTRARRQNHTARTQCAAIGQLQLNHASIYGRRNYFFNALQIHNVNFILTNLRV